ncbi:hypothetical protein E4U34_008082 [Claviceps purpurea]|nr:hypothetical protein E4U51_000511 [Claviceps purpurea]KAG6225237.1 hypothetical protein E4U26_003192 [Claviceps purpurea]KAG6230674.1 hypothetical protein E4U34_008082 [Claviceps purpurea]KAG6246294.1 hypothetical protein E4U23_004728 [Claviceps purpurea]KAG6267378.1 hypothetical protein E4U49_008167 [Claviceps purpurea]
MGNGPQWTDEEMLAWHGFDKVLIEEAEAEAREQMAAEGYQNPPRGIGSVWNQARDSVAVHKRKYGAGWLG